MRIFLAEDAVLIRAGLQELLESAGHEVCGVAGTAPELVTGVEASEPLPDLLITDVRMPPENADDGLRAAVQLRTRHPGLPVLVLSAYVSRPYAQVLLAETSAGRIGYLLKERVGHVSDFLSSIEVVASGGVVVDPEVVAQLTAAVRARGPLARLTPREHEVLELMAGGLSNGGIAQKLRLSGAAVSKHVANVFTKLDLPPGEDNRRVRAVLLWLQYQA